MKTKIETLFSINKLDARTPQEAAYDALMDGAGYPADEAVFLSDLTDLPPYGSRLDTERFWEEMYPRELSMLPLGVSGA